MLDTFAKFIFGAFSSGCEEFGAGEGLDISRRRQMSQSHDLLCARVERSGSILFYL